MREAIRTLIITAVCTIASSGCATTQLQSSWVKPDIGPLAFTKVVAQALSKSGTQRRLLEDAMVTEIRRVAPNVAAVPGYTLVPDEEVQDEARMRAAIAQGGFDGAVMLRITDTTVEETFIPGRTLYAPVYYRTFWGYYRHWVPVAFDPGTVVRDRSVQVETVVYSLNGETDMVYAAVSTTLNPDSPRDLVERVGRVVARDMREHRLLPS